MAHMTRSGSMSPPPGLMARSPSSASSSDVDLPPSPGLAATPVVRVQNTELWSSPDDDQATLVGAPKSRTRPPPAPSVVPAPRRRGTVATSDAMARSTSMILTTTPGPQQTSPVKMPKSTSFYATRRASTSLLADEAPRPSAYAMHSGRADPDPETLNAKMCVIGDAGVGKTSLINRYITGSFSTNQPSTIGASLLVKKMILPEGKINFQLWDTAGQERFRSLAPMYYRDCEAAAIVFDLTNRASFLAVKQWLIQIRKHAQNRDNLVLHFVGAKLDLAPEIDEADAGASTSQRQVSTREAKELIHQWLCEPERLEASAAPPSPASSSTSPSRHRGVPMHRSSTEGDRPAFVSRPSFFDFLPGRRPPEEPAPPPTPWAAWDYSEVSAKSDVRVDDVFRITSQRLLRRRRRIQHQQDLRHRKSVYLTEAAAANVEPPATGYACC